MPKKLRISGIIGWDVSADEVKQQLDSFNGEEMIVILANSPGGSVSEGIEIINLIKGYSGKKSAIISGFIASMTTGIVTAFDKKDVGIFKNSVFMVHNALLMTYGDYREHEASVKILKDLTNMLADNYSEYSGRDTKDILSLMGKETFITGGQNIIDENFAGYLLDPSNVELDGDDNVDENEGDDQIIKIMIETAKKEIKICNSKIEKLTHESDKKQVAAILKAVAYKPELRAVDLNPTNIDAFRIQNANIKKNNIQEGKKMNLKELLSQNVEAKMEFDIQLKEAIDKSVKAIKEGFSNLVNKVSPIFEGDSYDDAVKNQAIKVLNGELSLEAFKGILAHEDIRIEREKTEAAKNESDKTGDTPAHIEPPKGNGSVARTENDINKLAEEDKKKGV